MNIQPSCSQVPSSRNLPVAGYLQFLHRFFQDFLLRHLSPTSVPQVYVHRFLLEHLKEEAKRSGTSSAVITFANHPRKLIQPDFKLHLINTLDEKLANLESTGIDTCFLLDFTEEVRNLTAQQFICDILSAKLHVKKLLIGYDHRFGKNRAEGFDDYVRYGKTCGMEVVQEPVFDDGSGRNFSSSEVRRSLIAGKIREATDILGKPYDLDQFALPC